MKKLMTLILLTLMFLGCANQSDSNPKEILRVNHFQELPLCNVDYENIRALVMSEGKSYICSKGTWVLDI